MSIDTPFDWGDHEVLEGVEHSLRLGPLELGFTRASDELRLRFGDPPWARWVPKQWTGWIRLAPVFPDRLVVVKPESDFWLQRGARARVFLRIPLQVRVEALGPTAVPLIDVPTEAMSDTWWGSPEAGELSYWLDTRARRRVLDDEFEEHLCVCPLQLENSSGEDLNVDRIALRVEYLSIYRDGQRLLADETRVRYMGDDAESRIEMAGHAPAEAPEAPRISAPRSPMSRGFTAKTFARLRSSLGGWL